MPIYEFNPVDQNHPDWSASTYNGRCRVHAPDEARAGGILHAEFWKGTEGRNPDGTIVTPPWQNLERVTCSEPAYDPMPEYREGLIEEYRASVGAIVHAPIGTTPIGGGTSRWVSINKDRLPSQGNYGKQVLPSIKSSGGNVLPGPGHADLTVPTPQIGSGSPKGTSEITEPILPPEPPPEPKSGVKNKVSTDELTIADYPAAVVSRAPITKQTIRRVIQSRTVLNLQASALLVSLDELIGAEDVLPEQRNVSLVESLGLDPVADESELLSLLRELRDEIRGFREALEKAGSDPEKLEPSTLARLRDVGIDYISALAKNKVFVSTTGAALGCMLWTQLAEAGLIDTSQGYKLLEMIVKTLEKAAS